MSYSNCSDGDIRLAGGSEPNEGRVEICLNRAWGTVCHGSRYYYWDTSDATVVCRQLGHQQLGIIIRLSHMHIYLKVCVHPNVEIKLNDLHAA